MCKLHSNELKSIASESSIGNSFKFKTKQDGIQSTNNIGPIWFVHKFDPTLNSNQWTFTGDYWNRDWTKCPNIY